MGGGASKEEVKDVAVEAQYNLKTHLDYRLNGIKIVGDQILLDTNGIRSDLSKYKGAFEQFVSQMQSSQGEMGNKMEVLSEGSRRIEEKLGTVGADVLELKVDSAQLKVDSAQLKVYSQTIISSVKDVLAGMAQQDESLARNFEQLLENAKMSLAIQETVNRNYQFAVASQGTLLERFSQTERSLVEIQSTLDATLTTIKSVKEDVFAKLDSIVLQLKDEITQNRFHPIISSIKNSVNQFLVEEEQLKNLAGLDLVVKIKSETGILSTMKQASSGDSSLNGRLSAILDHKYAIPDGPSDERALIMLSYLLYGLYNFSLYPANLNLKYDILALHAYQANDLQQYNLYLIEKWQYFQKFTLLLLGRSAEKGLIDSTLQMLEEIARLEFIKAERKDILQVTVRNIASLKALKGNLLSLKELFEEHHSREKEFLSRMVGEVDFAASKVAVPIGSWQANTMVQYAIQFVNTHTGALSRIGEWSQGIFINETACPLVAVPLASSGHLRLVFRKFSGEAPQLVATLHDANQTVFRDINRDLFNAAGKSMAKTAYQEMKVFLQHSADLSTPFESGRTALHAAVEANNLSIVGLLLGKGAQIDGQDENGLTALHLAVRKGKQSMIPLLLRHGADINMKDSLGKTALHLAVAGQSLAILRLLLTNQQLLINAKNGDGFTVLHLAAMSGNGPLVRSLIEDGRISLDVQSKAKLTPLHLAVGYDHEEVVLLLLKTGNIRVNEKGPSEFTALHIACRQGSTQVMPLLLANGKVDVNAKTADGFTPLHIALQHRHGDIVRQLLAKEGVDIHVEGGKRRLTALHLAVSWGEEEFVKALLQKGAHLEALADGDMSPLHVAVENARLEVAELLFEKGSNALALTEIGSLPLHYLAYSGSSSVPERLLNATFIDQKDIFQTTPLYIAYKYNNTDLAKTLLDNSANAYIRLAGYQTQLHFAATNGDPTAVEHFLSSNNLPVDAIDLTLSQPLHYAASSGHTTVVRLLLEKNASVNARDSKKRTPLQRVLEIADETVAMEIASLLLAKQADINAPGGEENLTLLHLACQKGRLAFVQFLLEKGAKVNISLPDTPTPLQLASQENYLEIVKVLLENGAKISATNSEEQTALHYAIQSKGMLPLVQFLVEKGINVLKKDTRQLSYLDYALKERKMDIVLYLAEKSVDSKASQNGWTLLHYSAKEGDAQLIAFLVEKRGFSVDARNFEGKTPLHIAVEARADREVLRYFLKVNANVATMDKEASTLVLTASRVKYPEAVKFFGRHGANLVGANVHGQTPLYWAAAYGDSELVRWLLDTDASNLEQADTAGKTALQMAVHSADATLEMVILLVDRGANLQTTDKSGQTLPIVAARAGKLDVLKYLVESKGVDAKMTAKESGQSALHYAAAQGRADLVAFLLNNGAIVDAEDKQGRTALHQAIIEQGDLNLVRLFAVHKATLNTSDNDGNTLLDSALERGKMDIAVFLAENSANESTQMRPDWTLYHYLAAADGPPESHLKTLKGLYELDQEIDLPDQDGQTPLAIAIKQTGSLEVVQFLSEKGANVGRIDYYGATLAHEAAATNKLQIVKYLASQGVDLQKTNEAGQTPLHVAAGKGHLQVVKYLVGVNFANCFAEDQESLLPVQVAYANNQNEVVQFFLEATNEESGRTMMHVFAEKGQLRRMKELLAFGAKVESVDKEGSTLLHIAARYNQLSVLRYLITESCFAIDRKNNAGKTAFDIADEEENEVIIEFLAATRQLSTAIEKGNLNLVKTLIKQNAGLQCRTSKGWTALHLAAANGQLPIVQFLIEQGLKVTDKTTNGEKPYDLAKASGKKATKVETYLRGQSEALWKAIEGDGSLPEIKRHLSTGADVNLGDAKGWTALHRAVSAVKVDIIKLLLSAGGDTLAETNNGQTVIDLIQSTSQADILALLKDILYREENDMLTAIKKKDLKRVRKIHRQRDVINDSNFVSEDGWTGLHAAAYYGQLEMVKYFLAFGADPMTRTIMGETALDLAKRNDKTEVVDYLVNKWTAPGTHGWTQLHLTAAKNDLPQVRSILATGKVNSTAVNEQGDTPLMVAIAGSASLEMVQLLVDTQGNLEVANRAHSTPLLVAIGHGKGDITRYLLDKGAKLNVTDNRGWSALHLAAQRCDRLLITRLLKLNANINLQSGDGLTPLHVALSHGNCPLAIIVLLVFNGASVTTVDNNQVTLVFSATLANRPEIVEFLLEEGADFRAAEREGGLTPLHVAAQLGLDHLVKLLLNRGVDALAVNTQGETALHLALLYEQIEKNGTIQQNPAINVLVNGKYGPKMTLLHEAALKGNVPMVRELVYRGATVNEPNSELSLPLHCAVQGGSLEVVQYLVRNGANTCAVNGKGKTSLGLAIDLNRPKIAAYLKDLAKTVFFQSIEFGSLTLVADLLRKGVGHSCGNALGELPVHVAARMGQLAMLKLLKEQGADLEALTLDRRTPLDIARQHQQVAVIEYLSKVPTNRNLTATELHEAAQSGNLPKMRQLLRQGVAVNNEIDPQTLLTPLHLAAESGHFEAVKFLLENGSLVNAANNEGKTALHLAIKGSGTMEMVKYLIEKGARVSVADSAHLTPLIEAALSGKLEIVDYLLAQGASEQETTQEGFTALHAAASKGNLSIIDRLLVKDAQVNAVDTRGRSAIHIAIESPAAEGQLSQIMERFITAHADLNITDNNGVSLLLKALSLGRFAAANMLLDVPEVKVNQGNSKGWTALHEAVAKGNVQLIEKILQKGGEINARNRKGVTPLGVAVRSSKAVSPNLIALLIERGADVKVVDNGGATLLHDAIRKSPHLVVQLLAAGVNVNALDSDGSTALHEAAQYGQLPVIRQLLDSGANVNARNRRGQTAIQMAIVSGKATQQLLIQFEVKGANMKTFDDEDRSLVLDATAQGQLNMVQYLESKGASLREGNMNGTRPLHLAAKLGNLPLVEYLLEKGVPVNEQQKHNQWTALHLAVAGGHLEVVKYLIKKGADAEMITDTGETAFDLAASRKQFLIAKELTCIEGMIKENVVRRKRAISKDSSQAQLEAPFVANSSWLGTVASFLGISATASQSKADSVPEFAPTFYPDSFNLTNSLQLLDLLVRKITGERYYVSAKYPTISEGEARSAALSLAFQFEANLKKAGEKVGLQLGKGKIDKFTLYRKLEAAFQGENLTQVPGILANAAKNVYSGEKGQLWERTLSMVILRLLEQSQIDLPNSVPIEGSSNLRHTNPNWIIQKTVNQTVTNLLSPSAVHSKLN